jgi:hypothetical protein
MQAFRQVLHIGPHLVGLASSFPYPPSSSLRLHATRSINWRQLVGWALPFQYLPPSSSLRLQSARSINGKHTERKMSTTGDKHSNWLAFRTASDLGEWLSSQHHDTHTELEVKIFKKALNVPTVTWDGLVLECLVWGWIDGHRKSLDADSYLQRITPEGLIHSGPKKI